jgi:hypothetical protein
MVDHMQVFDTIIKEIDHGNGKRYMAILKDSMSDAPASLLAITTEMSGKDILAGADIGLKELAKRQGILKTKTYLVFAFRDAEEKVNYYAALAFAERTRMRLLSKDEAVWFYENFNKLPQWRGSLNRSNDYWTSSVVSDVRNGAWRFDGRYGYASYGYRSYDYGVRCVGMITYS